MLGYFYSVLNQKDLRYYKVQKQMLKVYLTHLKVEIPDDALTQLAKVVVVKEPGTPKEERERRNRLGQFARTTDWSTFPLNYDRASGMLEFFCEYSLS